MKKNIILSLVIILLAVIISFILNQVIVPNTNVDAALEAVNETSPDARTQNRFVMEMSNWIGIVLMFITLIFLGIIWFPKLSQKNTAYVKKR